MFHCANIIHHADPDLLSVRAEAVGSAQLPWSKICSNCWPSARVSKYVANQAVCITLMHVFCVIGIARQAPLSLLLCVA